MAYLELPQTSPEADSGVYVGLLLGAVDDWLKDPDNWDESDYDTALQRMEDLKAWIVELSAMKPGIIGEIRMFGGTSLPDGWLWCHGAVVSQADYSELYAVIGSFFAQGGEGAGQFRLPDYRNRSPFGVSDTVNPGQTYGNGVHTLTVAELPAHHHQQTVNQTTPAKQFTAGGSGVSTFAGSSSSNSNAINTQDTGGGAAFDLWHPVLGSRFMIYAGV